MTDLHSETLSAFLDGEPVDPEALEAALEDGASRRMLVDFVRLRQAVGHARDPVPASLSRLRHAPVWRRAIPLPAAAALVILAVLASLFLPDRFTSDREQEPPSPTRSLPFEPGVDWQTGD